MKGRGAHYCQKRRVPRPDGKSGLDQGRAGRRLAVERGSRPAGLHATTTG